MSNRFGMIALAAFFLGAAPQGAAAQAPKEPESKKPEGAQELFERAYYFENGLKKPEEAQAIYKRVAALAGSDRALEARALLRVAGCERQRGREMEALEVLKDVLERFQDLPDVKQEAETAINDAGAARRILRIYDVAMIVQGRQDVPAPRLALPATESRRKGGAGGGALVYDEDVPSGVAVPPDRLMDLIRTNIAPDTWESERAKMDFEGTRLIVVQSPEVHAEIEAYLAQLRAVRGRLVTIDATLAIVDGNLMRGLNPGAVLTPEQTVSLESAIRTGEGARLIARPRSTVLNGQSVALTSVRRRTFVGGFSVNQTGVVPTIDPEVETANEGLVFTARPTLVEDGSSVLIQVKLDGAEWHRSRKRAMTHGDIELPEIDQALIETSLLAPSGATVVAAILSTTFFDPARSADAKPLKASDCLVLTVRPTVSALSQEGEAGPSTRVKRPLRTYNVSLLTQRIDSDAYWRLVRPGGGSSSGGTVFEPVPRDAEEWGEPFSEEILIELVRNNIAPDSWSNALNSIQFVARGSGELVVVQTQEVHAQVRAYLASLRGERAVLLATDVYSFGLDDPTFQRIASGIRDAGPEASTLAASELTALLAGEVPGAKLRRQASGTVVNGQLMRIGQARVHRLVQSFERSSGGTGMVVTEVAAPVIASVGQGYELHLRAKVVPGGKLVMADVSLSIARLVEMNEAKTANGDIDLPLTTSESPSTGLTYPIERVLVVELGQGAPGIQERTLTLLRVRPYDVLGTR